jgi:succinate dehydrogenase flavin-adding protein (antitoxin of CptAB toxin-antitoxin module)
MSKGNDILRIQRIDRDTGEIVQSREAEGINYFNEDGYLFMVRKGSARVFQYIDFPGTFSDAEVGKLFRLKNHIQYNSNMLCKRSRDGQKAMTKADIINALNYQSRRGINFFNKLVKEGIIAEVTIRCGRGKRQIQYYINPLYFHSGKRVNVTLYNLFKAQLDPHLNQWVKDKFKTQQDTEMKMVGEGDAKKE